MNNRIEELAALADMGFDKCGMAFANRDHAEDGVDLQKFANLIIKDCLFQLAATRLEHVFDRKVDDIFVKSIDNIKEHFGINDDTN